MRDAEGCGVAGIARVRALAMEGCDVITMVKETPSGFAPPRAASSFRNETERDLRKVLPSYDFRAAPAGDPGSIAEDESSHSEICSL